MGGLTGVMGSYFNFRTFRSSHGGVAKYVLSGLMSIITLVVFFVLAIALNLLVGRWRDFISMLGAS